MRVYHTSMSQHMNITTVNPATGERISQYPLMGSAEVRGQAEAAAVAFHSWKRTSISERAGSIARLAAVLRAHMEDDAALITMEMGKPVTEARAEIEKCAWLCEYIAETGPTALEPVTVATDGSESGYASEPLGVILAIMPWNYPYWQAFRAVVPALMAGNTVVLKHAWNVTGCAHRIVERCQEAFDGNSLVMLAVAENAIIHGLIRDPAVAAVTLTGSTASGQAVAAVAGSEIKKCVLELGGSDAFVVLEDADVQSAAATAVRARFQNCGQSCIAAKRFVIHEAVYDEFLDVFTAGTQDLVVGDPCEERTQLGPLVSTEARARIEDQVARSLRMGAKAHLAGDRREIGCFLTPTILVACTQTMPVWEEEVFGPVAPVICVGSDKEALSHANHPRYGLGGAVWSRDIDHARHFAAGWNTGSVFINGMTHSDPRLPFGGIRESGYGRELSAIGIREFVNVKTFWVA